MAGTFAHDLGEPARSYEVSFAKNVAYPDDDVVSVGIFEGCLLGEGKSYCAEPRILPYSS